MRPGAHVQPSLLILTVEGCTCTPGLIVQSLSYQIKVDQRAGMLDSAIYTNNDNEDCVR